MHHRPGDTTIPRPIVSVALFAALFAAFANHAAAHSRYPPFHWNKPLWNETWTDRLKKDLLLKYDKYARPAQHYNTTEVTVDIVVHHVSLDDMKSILSVHAWLKMAWTDEKLKWNSSNYGGLEETLLGSHEIWQPDIYLFNSAAGNMVEHYGDTHCLVSEDGTVSWIPPSHFLAFCNLNLRLWPFDTQMCELHLGSWMFLGDQLDLHLQEHADPRSDLLIKNSEWELLEMTRDRYIEHHACCGEDVSLVFSLTIRRNALLYYNLIFTPTVPIVFLTLMTFWLPPQSEMKLMLGGCTALIVTIILIYLGNKVPPSGASVPLIVSFYSGCLYQITFSLILSVLVINMSKKTCNTSVPRIIKHLLLTSPVACLGVSDLIKTIKFHRPNCGQELHENHGVIGDNVTSNNFDDSDRLNMILPVQNILHLEWTLLATVIDRISFLIFCVSFSIMALMYIT